MSWIAAAIIGTAVVGGAVAVYSSSKASEASSEATAAAAQQTQAIEKTTAVTDKIALEQWDRYLEKYAPLEDRLIHEAQKDTPVEEQPGFARMLAGIDRGYSDIAANTRRTMGGRYPQGSGLETLFNRDVELERTRTKAGAVSEARIADEDNKFARMFNVAQLGRNLPSEALGGLNSGTAARAGLAGMFTNQANVSANQAAMGYQSAGNTAGNLMQLYLMSQGGFGGGGFGSDTYRGVTYV